MDQTWILFKADKSWALAPGDIVSGVVTKCASILNGDLSVKFA